MCILCVPPPPFRRRPGSRTASSAVFAPLAYLEMTHPPGKSSPVIACSSTRTRTTPDGALGLSAETVGPGRGEKALRGLAVSRHKGSTENALNLLAAQVATVATVAHPVPRQAADPDEGCEPEGASTTPPTRRRSLATRDIASSIVRPPPPFREPGTSDKRRKAKPLSCCLSRGVVRSRQRDGEEEG